MTGRLFSNAWLRPYRAAVFAAAGWALSLGAIAAGAVDAPCSSRANDAAPGHGFARAAARVAPAVVTVMVMVPRRDPFDENAGFDFFRPLAGVPLIRADEGAGTMALERSFASGFILDPDGQILTSANAVHEALETWVLTADGRRWPARVLGLDRRSDVALLKIATTRPDTVMALEVWRERARRRLMIKIARLATDVPRELTSRWAGTEVRLGLGLKAGKPASRAASGVYVETTSGSGLLAGIEPGDRITAINGMPVASLADFDGALESLGGSNIVALLVTRADVPMYVAIRREGR